MTPTSAVRREIESAHKLLIDANGDWVPGQRIIAAIRSSITPGRAVQLGVGYDRTQRDITAQEYSAAQIEEWRKLGLKVRAEKAIQSRLRSGVWVSKPAKITRVHIEGAAPFWLCVTDVDKRMSLADLERHLDIPHHYLVTWIKAGEAPPPARDRLNRPRFTPELVAIYEKIKEVYTGPRPPRWKSDPREIWKYPAVCPHCNEPLR